MKKKIFITVFTMLVVLMNSFSVFAEPFDPEALPTPVESTMTADSNIPSNNATQPTGELVIIEGATTTTAAPTESITTEIEQSDATSIVENSFYSEQNVATSFVTETPTSVVQSTSSESNNTLVIVIASVSGVIIIGLMVIIILLLKKKT